jgi:3-deoxy-7-phosphoheptulonate synthase
MIISKAPKLTPAQLAEVEEIVGTFDCRIQVIQGAHREVYAILGDERHELMFNRLIGLDYVDRVDHIESSYRLMDVSSELANHAIQIGGVAVRESPLFIAGPCTVDPKNPSLTIETAEMVKEAGAQVLRGGVWKPRTMPYSYQGDRRALDILLEAREKTGLPLNIEVMDFEQLEIALEAGVEMLQVGTRNALNYPLLRAIGEKTAGGPTVVLLKRGRHMGPIDEFICAAEYIVMAGNPNVCLCPRGTTPGLDGYRNHPDEAVTQLLHEKSWAPVIVDPSHAVGRAHYVPGCALAAMAYGADGICLEANAQPSRGIGDDPKQAVDGEALSQIIRDARTIWETVRAYRAPTGSQEVAARG